MKHLKTLLLVLLLVATLGTIVTTGHAEMPSRPASPCSSLGCEGGPDFCASIMFIFNNVVVVLTCYTKYVS